MKNIWFTADLHLGHGNIIKYCNRPFRDADEMNGALVTNWNAVVDEGDLVYVLGDFMLGKDPEAALNTAAMLRGRKFLVRGNHDRWAKDGIDPSPFEWIKDYAVEELESQRIVMCHYAFRSWAGMHHGSWNLHGHSHGTLPRDMTLRQLDVGVDCWKYRPVHLDEVRAEMAKVVPKPVDHHGQDA